MEPIRKKLKILVNKSHREEFNDNDIVLGNYSDYDNLEDCAIFTGECYEEIFGAKYNRSSIRKKLPVVKITFEDHSIYRRYKHLTLENLKDEDVCLTFYSFNQLSEKRVEDIVGKEEASISKGNWLPYYWFHPFHATRLEFRVGLPALLFSIISLVFSFISILSD